MLRLPRAPGGVGQIVLDPKVYNDMAAAVERFDALSDQIRQALNISAAPPLEVSKNVNGVRISMAEGLPTWPVKVTATDGFGNYTARRGTWKRTVFDPTAQLSLSDAADFTNPIDCHLWNQSESELAVNRIGPDTIVIAWYTPMPTADGKPVFGTIYNHAVRFVRFKENTGEFQSTTHDAAFASDVTAWDTWHQAEPCATDAVAEAAITATAVETYSLAYSMALNR